VGLQYRTGIYYTDCDDVTVINEFILRQQKNYDSEIVVEVMPLDNFYVAEDYHQDYLDKNPSGYCHLPLELFEYAKNVLFEKEGNML
jgi:peptide methionine sulfoxide reductase msrA/msrB